jgi:hypothetical protein
MCPLSLSNAVHPQSHDNSKRETIIDVLIEPEHHSVLEANPRLLTPHMMQQIATKGLPPILETKRWKRLFSVRRDGDSFLTFTNNVAQHKFTLMVVQTTDGDIFGAFADTEWGKKRRGGVEGHTKFFGTGQSCLFRVDNNKTADPNNSCPKENSQPNVSVYKWTGKNNYNQLFSRDDTMLALGGGGSSAEFGLCIRDSFSYGTSGSCETFDNPPLASQGLFEILRFEVYGFVRM